MANDCKNYPRLPSQLIMRHRGKPNIDIHEFLRNPEPSWLDRWDPSARANKMEGWAGWIRAWIFLERTNFRAITQALRL